MIAKDSLRLATLKQAASQAIGDGVDDSDLLIALDKLCLTEGKSITSADVSLIAYQKGFCASAHDDPRRLKAPKLSAFLFQVGSRDAFGLKSDTIELAVKSLLNSYYGSDPQNRLNPMANGGSPWTAPIALAASPWAETIGLCLNESHPQIAPLWPLACSLAGADPAIIRRCSSNAGAMTNHQARDAMLIMACDARDSDLLEAALAHGIDQEPTDECMEALKKSIARAHPHSSARKALRIEKKLALTEVQCAALICDRFKSRNVASTLLLAACEGSLGLPESIDRKRWAEALGSFAKCSVIELDLKGLQAIADLAQAKRVHCEGNRSPFGSSTHREGDKTFTIQDLDQLEASCIKKMLGPRSIPIGPDSPPLAATLIERLPNSGPSTQKLITSTIDRWCSQGFGAADLAWRKASAGHTISIGSTIASLPKQKDPSKNFETEISRWLPQLARQGFDFEAKASPKSKSLGERIRGSAGLKSHWPSIEAALLSTQTAPGTLNRKTPSL